MKTAKIAKNSRLFKANIESENDFGNFHKLKEFYVFNHNLSNCKKKSSTAFSHFVVKMFKNNRHFLEKYVHIFVRYSYFFNEVYFFGLL